MKPLAAFSVTLISSLMLLAALSSALASASPMTATAMNGEGTHGINWESTNWCGYAVNGSKGSVTSVQGSWTVPNMTAGTGRTTYYAAFWVGIDGFTSNTVEQTGILATTQGSTVSYYAWYEFYPSAMVQITSLNISRGDIISANVTYTGSSGKSGSVFTITINDTTKNESYTTTKTVANAARSSAEWIVEAPSSSQGILPLANFGTVNFAACSATINGTTGSIASFGSNVQNITMVTSSGVIKASPSAYSGENFSVTWASSGSIGNFFGGIQ